MKLLRDCSYKSAVNNISDRQKTESLMQYPTNSYLFIGIFPSQNGYQDDVIRRIFVALQSTRCSQKKQSQRIFITILFMAHVIL